ncbi:MAG: NfeD family protein [Phycisphaerales bacterium]|jgi:membrane-bound serine protease (ClpP class)|nr:NfeD family protein [Phycisphaerales bacterium]MDP6891144.1 NfeD family protein [Phycisphaerales bacterium]
MLLAQAVDDGGTTLLWGFLLLAAMIFLIAMELVVPSGGILAVAAAAALIGAIAAFFMHGTSTGLAALAAVIVLGPIAAWLGWKWWSETDMANRMVLNTRDTKDSRSHSGLMGKIGTAETDLRPIGTVRIDDRRHDALSDHGFITAGAQIAVVEVLDNQLKVRLLPEEKS